MILILYSWTHIRCIIFLHIIVKEFHYKLKILEMLKRQKNFRFILFVAEGLKFSLKYLGMKSISFSLNVFLFSPQFCSFQYKPKEACYFFRLVCKDICNGQENICIPATNVIDVPPMAPEGMLHFSTCTRLFLLLSSYYAPTNCMVKC